MATNGLKLFDENKTNIMTDADYGTNTQRLNGVQAGVASSMLQNKMAYQLSLVTYAIGQLMGQNGYDALDSETVTAFVGKLSNSVLQKVIDKATTVQAQGAADNTKWMTPKLVQDFYNYRLATLAEAEAGAENIKWMSPLRTQNFYIKRLATYAEAEAGMDNTKWMSPGRTKLFVEYIKATIVEAQTGVSHSKLMTPLRVKDFYDFRRATTSEIRGGEGFGKYITPGDLRNTGVFTAPVLIYFKTTSGAFNVTLDTKVKRLLVAMIGGGGGGLVFPGGQKASSGGGSGVAKLFTVEMYSGYVVVSGVVGKGGSGIYGAQTVFMYSNQTSPVSETVDGGGVALVSKTGTAICGASGGQASLSSTNRGCGGIVPVYGGQMYVATAGETTVDGYVCSKSPNILTRMLKIGLSDFPFCCAAGSVLEHEDLGTYDALLPNGKMAGISGPNSVSAPTDPGAGGSCPVSSGLPYSSDGANGGVFIYDWTGRPIIIK